MDRLPLKKARPEWDIVVLERELAGSRRQGATAACRAAKAPGSPDRFANEHGWAAVLRFQETMTAEVDGMLGGSAAGEVRCGPGQERPPE